MSETPPRATPGLPAAPAAARPSVIQLVFREKGALYAAYMPVFSDGGLFVPTTREYRLGDDIYLLLSLPDDAQRYPVAGKVAWITPANASGAPATAGRRPRSGPPQLSDPPRASTLPYFLSSPPLVMRSRCTCSSRPSQVLNSGPTSHAGLSAPCCM